MRLFKDKPPESFISDLKIVLEVPWEKVMSLAAKYQSAETGYEIGTLEREWVEESGVTEKQADSAEPFVRFLQSEASTADFVVADALAELREYGVPADRTGDFEKLLQFLSSAQTLAWRERINANTTALTITGIPVITGIYVALDSRTVGLSIEPGKQVNLPVVMLSIEYEKRHRAKVKQRATFQLTQREFRDIVKTLQKHVDELFKVKA